MHCVPTFPVEDTSAETRSPGVSPQPLEGRAGQQFISDVEWGFRQKADLVDVDEPLKRTDLA